MAARTYIAVDLGAESGRTVLAQFDGRVIQLEETHRFANGGVRVVDTLHWDLLRLWQEIRIGLGKSATVSVSRPAAVGIDTWGIDFGFLDADGRLLGNPVQYRDGRTEGMMERAFARVPRGEIYGVTGIQFMRLNSLYQLVAQAGTRHAFTGARTMLFVPDLFNYLMSGVAVAEYSIASTSQMLDAAKRDWARPILERLGIPTDMLPPVTATGTALGPLRAEVASATGLGEARVIATAGHDTAAAVAAVPGKGSDWCYISSGTWSLMGAELAAPCMTEAALAANFTNEGGVDGTIRFLKNIAGLWLVQQCRASFERAGRVYDYNALTRLAAEAPAFGPVINPDDDTLVSPDDMPAAVIELCRRSGQAPPTTDGAVVRCCLESLALRYRRTLQQLERTLGRSFGTIHVVGGGSRNEFLCQLTADCCERPVIAGPVEATALGNALVQALALGDLGSLADARQVVRDSFAPRVFEPRGGAGWDGAKATFDRIVGA
jgi:rhamnulokinase